MPFDSAPTVSAVAIVDEMTRLIEKRWVKGLFEHDGGYCLVGALQAADGDNLSSAGCRVWDAMYQEIGTHPITFNDRITTSKADVLAVLARTKARLNDEI